MTRLAAVDVEGVERPLAERQVADVKSVLPVVSWMTVNPCAIWPETIC